jgi:hypothetical protein
VKLLSVHALPPEFNIAPTVFIRRKGAVSPKLTALIEVLTGRADLNARLTARRKAGNIATQSRAGRRQAISPPAKTGRPKSPKSGKPELRARVSKTRADPSVEARSPAGR